MKKNMQSIIEKIDENQNLQTKEIDDTQSLSCNFYDIYDDDYDYISNKCAVEGFTIDNFTIVVWNDKLHKNKGFVKYFVNPYLTSTSGDPYKDGKKILGELDPNVLSEAQHPLVAAFPEVIVTLEKIIISKNFTSSIEEGQTQSSEQTKTITSSTSNENVEANTIGVKPSVNLGGAGIDVSLDLNYSHETTNIATIDEAIGNTISTGKETSWVQTLGLDLAKTAFLNTNLRYQNIGTAPVYDFEPTLSFVIGTGKKSETIATITAQKNSVAKVLLPNDFYPQINQNSLAFSTSDDFSSLPIMLNYQQVEKLNQGEKLQVQMTQFMGFYGQKNPDNQLTSTSIKQNDDEMIPLIREDRDGDSWIKIMADIYARTACITIKLLNNKMYRRRVAVRKALNYEQQTLQELTLGQAISIAFPDILIDQKKHAIGFQGESLYVVKVSVDQATETHLKHQIAVQNLQNIFDLKLVQGMNLRILQDQNQQIDNYHEKENITIMAMLQIIISETRTRPFKISPYKFDENFDSLIDDIKQLFYCRSNQQFDIDKVKINLPNLGQRQINLALDHQKIGNEIIITERMQLNYEGQTLEDLMVFSVDVVAYEAVKHFHNAFKKFTNENPHYQEVWKFTKDDQQQRTEFLKTIFYYYNASENNASENFDMDLKFSKIQNLDVEKFKWWK